MKRRDFVTMVSAAMGTSFLVSCRKNLYNDESLSHLDIMAARQGGGHGSGTVIRYPLRIPDVVSPSNLSLNSTPSSCDLGGGQLSNAWTYNGKFPGPTIVANRGDHVVINLTNSLPQETITHWHGMFVDHMNDGHPMEAIPGGSSYHYDYYINQRAALNFYHPHPHMHTAEQVYLGQAGAFIIRDSEEASFNLPSGKYEVPLIIRDATLDRSNNLSYKPAAGGMFGKIPLINGTRSPYLSVDKAIYRFRILNGANSRIFNLALNNNISMRLIGNDGGLLPASVDINNIDLANAERADVLVDFRSYANGTSIMLRDLREGWDLLEFRVGNTSGGITNMPVTSSAIPLLSDPVTTRVFSFEAMSKINGLEYDINRIDFQVPWGQTEKWIFKTNGNAPHPVHVHNTTFQVISRTGGRNQLFPWESGWKDTVLLEDGETVEVLVRFGGTKGLYLIHCHKLEHEDMGMMSNFEIV